LRLRGPQPTALDRVRNSDRSSARRTRRPAHRSARPESPRIPDSELDREVEAAAERRQRIRALAAEDVGDALDVERLDVGAVGEAGSVMIVAGFELTTIVRNPSSRTLSAWQPE
jgi:hypothetical protein